MSSFYLGIGDVWISAANLLALGKKDDELVLVLPTCLYLGTSLKFQVIDGKSFSFLCCHLFGAANLLK